MIRDAARPYSKVGLYEMTWLSASAVQPFSPRAMLHEIKHALKLIGLLNINSESGRGDHLGKQQHREGLNMLRAATLTR
jgi:hypothetical protein